MLRYGRSEKKKRGWVRLKINGCPSPPRKGVPTEASARQFPARDLLGLVRVYQRFGDLACPDRLGVNPWPIFGRATMSVLSTWDVGKHWLQVAATGSRNFSLTGFRTERKRKYSSKTEPASPRRAEPRTRWVPSRLFRALAILSSPEIASIVRVLPHRHSMFTFTGNCG